MLDPKALEEATAEVAHVCCDEVVAEDVARDTITAYLTALVPADVQVLVDQFTSAAGYNGASTGERQFLLREAASTLLSLSADLARKDRHIEELQQKNAAETCACSYDNPGDVCLGHSPTVEALSAENARLRSLIDEKDRALEPFAKATGHFDGYVKDDDNVSIALRDIKARDLRAARATRTNGGQDAN